MDVCGDNVWMYEWMCGCIHVHNICTYIRTYVRTYSTYLPKWPKCIVIYNIYNKNIMVSYPMNYEIVLQLLYVYVYTYIWGCLTMIPILWLS